jgi:very-short-patch-repair endonuclease
MSFPTTIANTPFVQAAITQACATLSQWQREELTAPTFYRHCESPLEAAWRIWWYVVCEGLDRTHGTAHRPHALYQHKVEADGRTYRLDVAIVDWPPDGTRVPLIAVELDGHTFHERTRQQVADRNARDRALQLAGWTILHFSYDEMKQDGLRCAIEVLDLFDTLTAAQERTA